VQKMIRKKLSLPLNGKKYKLLLAAFLVAASIFFAVVNLVRADEVKPLDIHIEVVGNLINAQKQPIKGALVEAVAVQSGEEVLLAEDESQEDGSWAVALAEVPENLTIRISRPHYADQSFEISAAQLGSLAKNGSLLLPTIVLERKLTAAFWASGVVFLFVLLVIATERLHSTTASLAAMSAIFLISFVGGAISRGWFIFDFETALSYINWEVILLVLGMMIIIAVLERTGLFQWTAFQAYRLSRGKSWLLVLILILVTAVASALLDNFTTMLLMTPISLQIALALGINPFALIIPEVMASNIGGITTLIGTPTNIIIGAYAGIGFTDFLANQTLGIVLALAAMSGFVLFFYRKEWKKTSGGISERLYELLEKNGQIRDKDGLIKSGIVFALVMVGFVVGEKIHIVPAVPALIGATLLFVWLRPNVNETIEAVDWTTLVFFMSLFIVIGAVQEVGLISVIAVLLSKIVGKSLILAVILVVLGVGTLSTAIANIPLAASMLPVVEYLTGNLPGASNKVLYYALSMGAAMGGNGLVIGAEANLVTAGITEQAGNPISFKEFMRIGLPVTYITLAVGTLWLLVRFILFA
jgi:Na+/H+ antiporter NhaD/arsenite permease-like protein